MYYARKIERAKWNEESIQKVDELNADALNSIMTKSNKLSIWEVDDLEKLIDIATALNTTRNSISKIDFVLLEKDFIDKEFHLDKVPGETAIADMNVFHYDLTELNLDDIIKLTKTICTQLKSSGKMHYRFTKPTITKNFSKMMDDNRIDQELCKC